MYVNLLPKRFRMQLMLRAQLRQWSKIWALCLLVAVALNGARGYHVVELGSRLSALQQQLGPLERTQQQIAQTSRRISQLTAQAEATEQIQSTDRSLPLLGILSQSAHSTDGNIQIVRLTVQSTTVRQPAAARGRSNAATAVPAAAGLASSLSIQGIATDDRQLSQFVNGLRQFKVFDNVDLRSSTRMTSSSDEAREFQLECRY